MSGRLHKGLRRLADEQFERIPRPRPRRRSWLRRLWDWCCGVEPPPPVDYQRRARRNVKRQYRRWKEKQS